MRAMMAATLSNLSAERPPESGTWTRRMIAICTAVEEAPPEQTGALQFGPDGRDGAILVERGRVCWVMARSMRQRLTELLRHQVDPPLDSARIESIYLKCKKQGLPLGETLVREGVVSSDQLRRTLCRHNAEGLAMLSVSSRGAPSWVTHTREGYDARFTFTSTELFTAVAGLRDPAAAELSRTELAELLAGGGVGAVFERRPGAAPEPIGEVATERLGVIGLLDLGSWAAGVLDVAGTIGAAGKFAAFRRGPIPGALLWEREKRLYTALFDDASLLACAMVRLSRVPAGERR